MERKRPPFRTDWSVNSLGSPRAAFDHLDASHTLSPNPAHKPQRASQAIVGLMKSSKRRITAKVAVKHGTAPFGCTFSRMAVRHTSLNAFPQGVVLTGSAVAPLTDTSVQRNSQEDHPAQPGLTPW